MQLLKHDGSIPAQFFGSAQKQHAHRAPSFHQSAGYNESVAAIVPFAANNSDPLRLRILRQHEARDRRARVFHQAGGRHAEALRGNAINLAHFRRAYNFHSVKSPIGYSDNTKRATAAPAFSIKLVEGTPKRSEVMRSISRISAALTIFIASSLRSDTPTTRSARPPRPRFPSSWWKARRSAPR